MIRSGLLRLLLSLTVVSTMGSPAVASQDAPLLLMTGVRIHGDAQIWRWWCPGHDDPLARAALLGLAQGLQKPGAALPMHTLPEHTAAVHPMYCQRSLGPEMASNLAGLLDASGSRGGLLEIGQIERLSGPGVLSVQLSYRTRAHEPRAVESSETTGGTEPGIVRDAPEFSIEIVAATSQELPQRILEGALSLGRRIARRQSAASKPQEARNRLPILVRGSFTDGFDDVVGARIREILPGRWEIAKAGFFGQSVLFVIEAPEDEEADMLATLNTRLMTPRGGPPPLIFEGFSPQGVASFGALQTELPPWHSEDKAR